MNNPMKPQQGMVLLVSLILLLMLTLIAIAASSRSTLQVRIASNSEMRNGAFMAAEAGLATCSNSMIEGEVSPYGCKAVLEDGKTYKATLGNGQVYTVDIVPLPDPDDPSRQTLTPPCLGGGIGQSDRPPLSCVDLVARGGAGCTDDTLDNCAATTRHRQGIQYFYSPSESGKEQP